MKYIVAVKITLRFGGMHMRHFGQSGDCGLPFSSASLPKSLQTAVTASLIDKISASPAAGSPDCCRTIACTLLIAAVLDQLSCLVTECPNYPFSIILLTSKKRTTTPTNRQYIAISCTTTAHCTDVYAAVHPRNQHAAGRLPDYFYSP